MGPVPVGVGLQGLFSQKAFDLLLPSRNQIHGSFTILGWWFSE